MQLFAPRLVEAHGPESYASDFDFSIEPYAGCNFGCAYCFVPHKTKYVAETNRWGKWRHNQGIEGISAEALSKLRGARVLLAGRTDAWQPVERKRELTREILRRLVDQPCEFLLASTRSTIIERDTNLLEKAGTRVLVSISINTDDRELMVATEPLTPPVHERLMMAQRLTARGLRVRVAVAPVLRHSSRFFDMLMDAVPHVWIDEPDPAVDLRPDLKETIYFGSELTDLFGDLQSRFGSDRVSFGRYAFSGQKCTEHGRLQ